MIKNTTSSRNRFGTHDSRAFLYAIAEKIHQPIGNICPLFLVNAMAKNIRYEFSIFSIYKEESIEQLGGGAPTWQEAWNIGNHYLAIYQKHGPTKLELRRVEVLAPDALPPKVGHIFRLAEIIREVDGNHSLGADALAEAILAHPRINHVLPQGQAKANDIEDAHLFRLWIRGAAECPGVLAGLLSDCFSPQDYREALRKFEESSPTLEEPIQ